MKPVVLPPMPTGQSQAWLALIDLAARFTAGWTLVGGQLVYLHCIERGSPPVRATNDGDAVLDVRAHPGIHYDFTKALSEMGFSAPRPSGMGVQHRWIRGDAVIDVLVPRFLGSQAAARAGAGGAPTIATPDAQGAIDRTERIEIVVADVSGEIPRPTLVGAIAAKAAALEIVNDPGWRRHVQDVATLATVPGASVVGEADAMSILDSGHGSATYVQPLGSGIGLMKALPNASGIESFTYELDVPEGTQLQALPNGSFVLRTLDGGTVGGLRAPLAVDGDGNPVPSTFDWSSAGILTQTIDATSIEPGPVVSIMSWTYGLLIPIDRMTNSQKSEQVYNSMRNNCFNCLFPVQGAPTNWPAMGQHLPLYVGVPLMNFACTFNGSFAEWLGGSFYWGFDFRAAPGHIDGVGSTISFQIIPGTDGPQRSLWVDAWIMNDLLNNDAYRVGAALTWVEFASRMSAAS